MTTIILDLEADRVLAIEASLSRGRVNVARAFTESIPDGIRDDARPDAIGGWLREQLGEHGFKGKAAIVAASRAEVLVKRLDAPGGDLNASERHEMVRLQMTRQASMTSASSVIDYAEHAAPQSGEGDGGAPDESGVGTESVHRGFVVASAMPTERVRAREDTVKAAGLRLDGIRLRTAGVRALLAGEHDQVRPTLVVTLGVGSAELLILVGGVVVSSRSVPTVQQENGDGPDVFAHRVAVEASRTLVSFRVSPEGGEIDHAVIVAGGAQARALADAIADRLGIPANTLDPASLMSFGDGVDPADHAAIAPLAGLMLCKARGIKALDFANPTAPPDTTAGIRAAVLAALFFLIVLGGTGYVFGQRRLEAAERERDQAKERYEDAYRADADRQLNGGRLGHIRAWAADPIDWPAHVEHLMALLPDDESVSLGQIGVRLDSSARFTPGKKLGDLGAWNPASTMAVTVTGVARDRGHISDFRESLLDSGLYTVSSQGPEVENRFTLRIATATPSPTPPAAEEQAPDSAADATEEGEP